jgi:hypothetical protein
MSIPGLPIASGLPIAPSLFNATGIPLGKTALILLTMFPPTGYLGLNYSAVGLPITAGIKAAVYGLGIAIGIFANRLYINEVAKVLSYILIFAPPWYIFDCIRIISDSQFDQDGFIPPVPVQAIPTTQGNNGNWNLTFPLLSLILATTSFSGLAFVSKYLPATITDSIGKYSAYATAGGGALFILAAGVGLLMQRPASTNVASTGVSTGVPTIPGLGGLAQGLMKGGGANSLPPLSSFINKLTPQSGGSKEDVPFLGILALVILGGFSLSFLRSKQ